MPPESTMPISQALLSKQDQGARDRRTTGAVLLIVLPFLIQAFAYLTVLFRSVVTRNDTTYPEGVGVYAALRAWQTGHLYSDPFQFPWNYQMYGPVFYFFGYIFAKLTHGSPLLTAELMRSLSLLSFLGSAGLVSYLSLRLEGRRLWAAVSIIFSLACAWAVPYCASTRADALSIFFILAALTVYHVGQGRTWLVFWAGVLAGLGFLSKQSVMPLLFALALDTVIARRFRNTAALIGGSAVVSLLVLSALWLRHEPFLVNFTVVRGAVVVWSNTIYASAAFVRVNQISVIALFIALVGIGQSWRKEKYRPLLLAIGFGCLANVAALANTGGDVNYFILPWLLIVLMVPAGLTRIEKRAGHSVLVPVVLASMGVVILFHQRFLLTQHPPQDLETRNVNRLRMLSDLPYLEMYSRSPAFLDPFFYHQLSLQGRWSSAPIVTSIERKEYDLILLAANYQTAELQFFVQSYRGYSNWGSEELDAMRRNYRPLCEVPGVMALVPRDRSETVRDTNVSEIFQQPCHATNKSPQMAPETR